MPKASVAAAFNELALANPSFPLESENVSVLSTPTEFFQQLLSNIRQAQRRISISSLYIGTDKLSCELIQTLHDAIARNPSLQVSIVLDYSRGQRGGTTANSSVAVLTPLLKSFPDNVKLHLYRVPQLENWASKRLPPPFDETMGVSHSKVYLCDDTLIMSGANLSGDYFTQRQDRYVQIISPYLGAFYHEFVDVMAKHAHYVSLDKEIPIVTPPTTTSEDFANALSDLQQYPSVTEPSKASTWAMPTIQFSPLRVLQDQHTLVQLLSLLPDSATIDIASGYLNFPPFLTEALVSSGLSLDVLTAAPSANGFFNGNGIKGALPMAYSHIEAQFYNQFSSEALTLREYNRNEWTFHGKGLWVHSKLEGPVDLTIVGSSNFGQRSYGRDLESQVYIYTQDPKLQAAFQKEYQDLHELSERVTDALWKRADRQFSGMFCWKYGHWIRPASRAVISFL
ncbi:CDP-diacylglycerol-glycerol-3-phosphate 3-phosphatidyltransferase [Thraustotheca clavata]|uniref:CDP-diacylglycerol--glycerol-3-phosphate 3-phosphatidyltransferase n=1 Tax=Thraustotheca clavata TaxID=74557 RepID=A0A1V9ZYJ7_9STRA|nr:CDP-diacylglycerol-glycerol-3-phosphate 3-phosphatidyltransferase [Thraustotheca clavata]